MEEKVPKVYFVRSGEYIKIGRTDRPIKKRMEQMSTGTPYPMEALIVFTTPIARKVEKMFHQYFALKRTKGEWFKLSTTDLTLVHDACVLFLRGYGRSKNG